MNKVSFSDKKTLTSSFGLDDNSFSQAKVDIIIPFRNCYQSVMDLLDSLFVGTTGCSYLVTLIDDGSSNVTFGENLARKRPVMVKRNEKPIGFGGSVNIGLQATQNPYVVVMHSDCKIMQSGWLSYLGNYLLANREDGIKLVHPRTNVPTIEDHPQLPPTEIDEQLGGGIATEPLPLICFLCNRMLFDKIGGFQSYYPLGYENYEFFYRMKRMRFQQAVCLESFVFHYGSKSIDLLKPKEKLQIEKNYDIFLKDYQNLNTRNRMSHNH
jgi:GT2 family glycosyltransferase